MEYIKVIAKKIWKSVLPEKLREKIWIKIFRIKRSKKKREILSYYYPYPDDLSEQLKFIKKRGLREFPYDYVDKYQNLIIDVYSHDEYPYVLHNGKRLYGPKEWSAEKFVEYYRRLLIEQDEESPHRYISQEIDICGDDIIADLGAAEGIFTLDCIDKVKYAYLFEADQIWIEPLRRTFVDYKEKICIVEKYIGSELSDSMITMDDYFSDKEISLIKADIEGAEIEMIQGGESTMRNKVCKAVVCTYHNADDFDVIDHMLQDFGFSTYPQGYVIRMMDVLVEKPPYFRHCMIKAIK